MLIWNSENNGQNVLKLDGFVADINNNCELSVKF